MTGNLKRKENRNTDRYTERTPCDDKAEPITPEAWREQGLVFLEPSEGAGPVDTLVLDF